MSLFQVTARRAMPGAKCRAPIVVNATDADRGARETRTLRTE
jgi:hypothetical protein